MANGHRNFEIKLAQNLAIKNLHLTIKYLYKTKRERLVYNFVVSRVDHNFRLLVFLQLDDVLIDFAIEILR